MTEPIIKLPTQRTAYGISTALPLGFPDGELEELSGD